jgi:O-antigen ligase
MSSNPLPAEHSGYGQTRRGPGLAESVLQAVLGAAVLFYFVVRGELGATLVLVGLFCAGSCIVHHVEVRRSLREPAARWLALAFAAPIAVALAVNLVHHQVVWRSFDAALRFLLAVPIFLELRRRGVNFAPVAAIAFPGAITLCAAWIFLVPNAAHFYWDGRFATYFIDPLTLSQHMMIAALLCLFLIDPREPGGRWRSVVTLVAILLALVVALGTQSRTGWIMVPILLTVWLMRGRHPTPLQWTTSATAALFACAAAYWMSEVVRLRVDTIGTDIAAYLSGADRDTSVGIRLSLFRTALILFAEQPLLGWGFGSLPDIRAIPAIAPFYTPALQSYFVGAGVHNEFLQALMRMGIVGFASRVVIYAVPFWIFVTAIRSSRPTVRQNGYLGLVVVVGYVTAGLTSEVTNLIYAASFYALLVAVFAAGALPREPA